MKRAQAIQASGDIFDVMQSSRPTGAYQPNDKGCSLAHASIGVRSTFATPPSSARDHKLRWGAGYHTTSAQDARRRIVAFFDAHLKE